MTCAKMPDIFGRRGPPERERELMVDREPMAALAPATALRVDELAASLRALMQPAREYD